MVKESVIRPCDKTECDLKELMRLCIGVIPCCMWVKKEETEEGFLTFSITARCNSLNFCLWKQNSKTNKLELAQRFNIHNINLAQLESSIKYVRNLSFVKIREIGGGIKRID